MLHCFDERDTTTVTLWRHLCIIDRLTAGPDAEMRKQIHIVYCALMRSGCVRPTVECEYNMGILTSVRLTDVKCKPVGLALTLTLVLKAHI